MSVIDFAAAKAEREPHSAGVRVCLGCRHEWVGVAPLGMNDGMECPSCHLPKGVTKNLYAGEPGDLTFTCNCGCDVMFVHIAKGQSTPAIRCLACGTDQTGEIYG